MNLSFLSEASAMEENSTQQTESRGSKSPACPDRILDRKIERRGLTQSFSSNLARRGQSSGRKVSDRSVRDMVSMFEKSDGPTSTSNTPNSPSYLRPKLAADAKEARRGSHNSDHNTATDREQHRREHGQPNLPQSTKVSMFPSAQVGYQVEDYSLTLLQHKSYFNNRPLGRCLDESHEKDRQTKIQRVKSKKERASGPEKRGEQDRRKEAEGQGEKETSAIVPPKKNRACSPIAKLDTLMTELLAWNRVPGPGEPMLDENGKGRSREVIEDFWRSVRTQLWVDEDEIYGEPSRQAALKQSTDLPEKESDGLGLKPSERPPPPMPTRPPPPVPASCRKRSSSNAISSQQTQRLMASFVESSLDPAGDYLAWNEPLPSSSIRLSISTPGPLGDIDFLPDACLGPEWPTLQEPGRPLPDLPMNPSHSRYPSSNSGHWIRPPTWRSPSSMRSSSPPPVPPLPVPGTAPEPSTNPRHRSTRSRHRQQQQPSKTSASTSTSISTHSVAVTDSSGGRSMHSRRTTKTSTSSTATRSTRADSGADLSAVHVPRPPRRRLTTEEKLSEIDAFLSHEPEGDSCWI